MVETKARLTASEISAVGDLLEVVAKADGHQPLGDQKWLDLIHGGAPHFCAFLVVAPSLGQLAGYAQLSGDGAGTWGLETAIHPEHRAEGQVLEALLEAVFDEVRSRDGGEVHYFVAKPTEDEDQLTTAAGFARWREVWQLRVSLPLPEAPRAGTPAVAVRAFRVGADEDGWLAMNNRAFAGHPEQG